MKALLIKDGLIISKDIGRILIFVLIFSTFLQNFVIFAIMIAALLPMNTIAIDEKCGFDKLARVYPFSNVSLTLSKYLIGYICIAIVGGLSFAAQSIIAGQPVYAMLLGIFVGSVVTAFSLPFIFKFGMEKGRVVYMVIAAPIFALIAILQTTDGIDILMYFDSALPLLSVAIVINVLSIVVSIKFNEKRG